MKTMNVPFIISTNPIWAFLSFFTIRWYTVFSANFSTKNQMRCLCFVINTKLLLKKGIYLIHGQVTAGYDALLYLHEVGLVQYAAIPSLVLHKHVELCSDRLRTIGVGVVTQKIVVLGLEWHLTGKHPGTLLNIGVYLRINHHRAHKDAVFRHTSHDE